MSALTFTLKEPTQQQVDMSALTPDKLAGMPVQRIAKLKLPVAGRQLSASRLFEISGDDPRQIRILKSCNRLDRIGDSMADGEIEVRGEVGDYLGDHMLGGKITVKGNAGDWVAAGMQGGHLEILGDVGQQACGTIPGAEMGMEDGMVYIAGNAGDRAGDKMRRGLLIIEGDAGDHCGSRLLGGTIVVLGTVTGATGFGMRRGSIVLRNAPDQPVITYNSSGILKMEFLRVLFKHIGQFGRRFSRFKYFGPEAERLVGDMSQGGKGEIFVLQNAPM